MKRLVSFPLDDGETILVEVNELENGGMELATPTTVIEKAQYTFGQALDKIKPIAETIIDKLRDLRHRPDEVQVTFGVKLTAEAGALIAAASAEGNYEIVLTWKSYKE